MSLMQADAPNNTIQRTLPLKPVRSTQVDWTFRARSRQLVDENPNSRENIMRRTLESLLGHPCPKQRPSFLRSPATNRCLELDAYCVELRVACEFQGIQHDRYPNPVHTSHAQFLAQVNRDRMKAAMCKEHGVCLLLVPHTVSRAGMASFLKAQLKSHQIPMETGDNCAGCQSRNSFRARNWHSGLGTGSKVLQLGLNVAVAKLPLKDFGSRPATKRLAR